MAEWDGRILGLHHLRGTFLCIWGTLDLLCFKGSVQLYFLNWSVASTPLTKSENGLKCGTERPKYWYILPKRDVRLYLLPFSGQHYLDVIQCSGVIIWSVIHVGLNCKQAGKTLQVFCMISGVVWTEERLTVVRSFTMISRMLKSGELLSIFMCHAQFGI